MTIKKSRPGIATAARPRSRAAGSSVAKSAVKKPRQKSIVPMKEYEFPSDFAPELLIVGLLLLAVVFLIFASR